MTPAEEVELRAKQAGIDAQYVTAQVLTPEEVAINRFRADGWSPETSIDLAARKALLDEDDAGEDGRVDARGAEHAAGVAGVVARVAAREIPRATGVELLVQAFELDATAADRAMGEAGRTWFTAPEPTHAAELDAMRADLAKAQASLRGHQAYTARLIQRAKAGGLELGAFTAREPTEVGEGDVLEPGDVVAVPVQDGRATGQRVDAHASGVAVVLELPSEAAAGLPTLTPPKDLHVTLAFLDDAPEASDAQARLIEAVRSWAQSVPQITATLGGIGRFPAGPDGEPVYVPVDAPDLAARRVGLVSALQGAGFEASQAHGFTPHVTLAYLAPEAPTPDPVPPRAVTFARVAIWAGWWRWSCSLDPDRADAGDDHWKEQGRDQGKFTSGPSRAGGSTSAKPKGLKGGPPTGQPTTSGASSASHHPTTAHAFKLRESFASQSNLHPRAAKKMAVGVTEPDVPGAPRIITVSNKRVYDDIKSGKIKLAPGEELGYPPEHDKKGKLLEDSHVEVLGARWAVDKYGADGGTIGTVPTQCKECKRKMSKNTNWIHTNPEP